MATTQFGGPGQRRREVLDTGAAGVVDTDDRAADHGHPLHQPGYLAAEHLADRTAEHRLVLKYVMKFFHSFSSAMLHFSYRSGIGIIG